MSNTCKTPTKPKSLSEFLKSSNFWKPVSGVLIGATLGYLYYYFLGCNSGTCAITSDPVASIISGGVLGLLVTNSPCRTC